MTETPNERTEVELPLIEQLKGLGWRHLKGDIEVPYVTERSTFREVLLAGRLREALTPSSATKVIGMLSAPLWRR